MIITTKKPIVEVAEQINFGETIDYETANAKAKQLEEEAGSKEQTKYEDMLGLKVADLTDNLRTQYSIPDDIKGVVVVGIQRRSFAHHYIEKGDIITAVNQHNVTSAKEFNNELLTAITSGRKNILLSVKSGSTSIVITLPLHYEDKKEGKNKN